jgi:pilus assembly protein Flp/PilA
MEFLLESSSVSQRIWVLAKEQSEIRSGRERGGAMFDYLTTWMCLKTDRRAVTALEYGLIASLIAVAIIGGVTLLGGNLSSAFSSVSSSV